MSWALVYPLKADFNSHGAPENMTISEREDRLSFLPNDILVEILSLIPTKTAIATGTLSRQWHNLWTQITSLDFTEDMCEGINTFTGQLQRLTAHVFDKVKFQIGEYIYIDLHDIIGHICDLNVREMQISYFGQGYCPPSIFRTCSLVTLRLGRFYDIMLCDIDSIDLPKLRTLSMHLVLSWCTCRSLEKIVSSCPSLEDLYLNFNWTHHMTNSMESFVLLMSNRNLRLLNITGHYSFRNVNITVDIEAPSLKHFTLNTCPRIRCKFLANSYTLLEADISLNSDYAGDNMIDMMTAKLELYRYISNVRCLTLNSAQLHAGSTVFPNLIHLSLTDRYPFTWKGTMGFLIRCPNLRKLMLHSRDIEEEVWGALMFIPSCMLMHVKIIELKIELYKPRIELHWLSLVRSLLSCAKVLEYLIIDVVGNYDVCKLVEEGEQLLFFHEVCRRPRSSLQCQIDFYGIYSCMGTTERVWALKS